MPFGGKDEVDMGFFAKQDYYKTFPSTAANLLAALSHSRFSSSLLVSRRML